MRRKKKTTIVTFESRERLTIRSGATSQICWCERCFAEVLMVTPSEAASRTGVAARTIFRGIESGAIHFIEEQSGTLLVCLKSVSALCAIERP